MTWGGVGLGMNCAAFDNEKSEQIRRPSSAFPKWSGKKKKQNKEQKKKQQQQENICVT